MKEPSDHQRTGRLPPKPPAVAVTLLAGFMGLACSRSGLKTSPGDAGVVGGGQTGGSMSSGSTGGAGGFPGPAGVASGTGGQGGSATSSPCLTEARCNVGQVLVEEHGNADLSKECPAERECYALYNRCTSTLCVLPEGVHCTDKITCNPGDTETSLDGYCSQSPCYTVQLCTNSIWCKYATDVGATASASDAAVDGDALAVGYCGDGIVQVDLGEQCDWGAQNGELQGGYICTRSCQLVPYLP